MEKQAKEVMCRQVWVGIYANKHQRKRGVPMPKKGVGWCDACVRGFGFEEVRDPEGRIVGFGLCVHAGVEDNHLEDSAVWAEEMVPDVQVLFDQWLYPHTATVCTAPLLFQKRRVSDAQHARR